MNRAKNGDRIASCALEAFCEKGFKGASIRTIAARSGVSVGNLYNHAPSKEALFDRLFEERFPGAHIERIFTGIRSGTDLDGAVATILANMLRYAEEDPYFFRLVMVDLNEFGGEHLRRHTTGRSARPCPPCPAGPASWPRWGRCGRTSMEGNSPASSSGFSSPSDSRRP
jgi:AcrR family transcriptional regulator